MEYVGAVHYFFWMGVEKGLGSSIQGLPGWLDGMCPIENQTSRDCREAFSWGFCWGLATDELDFINPVKERKKLIKTASKVIMKEQEPILKKLDDDYPFKGEC